MLIELRNYDKETIVIYTESDELAKELKEICRPRRVQTYEEWPGGDPRRAKVVGFDLFFDRECESELKKRVKMIRKASPRQEAA